MMLNHQNTMSIKITWKRPARCVQCVREMGFILEKTLKVFDSILGDTHVFFVRVHHQVSAVRLYRSYAGTATSAERVKNHVILKSV